MGAYSIGSKMPTVLYASARTVETFTPLETGRRDRSKVRNSTPRVEALEASCGAPVGRPLSLSLGTPSLLGDVPRRLFPTVLASQRLPIDDPHIVAARLPRAGAVQEDP